MIFTITTTHRPATDLGFLLHKNPDKVHSLEMPFGMGHVFYPEVSDERCTAALLIEIDPVNLVRGRPGANAEGGLLDQYVNDRPYAATSFLSQALGRFFRSAMNGRSLNRQELAEAEIPLEIRVPVLPSRGGEGFLKALFGPLGYEMEAIPVPLDEKFEDWGRSRYYDVTLRTTKKLSEVLCHLYVLIPVLDDDKHYWVSKDEIEKLLRRGKGWLESHPRRDEITLRYLRRQRHLTRDALAQMSEVEGDPDPDETQERNSEAEEAIERPLSLHEQRLHAVLAVLKGSGAKRVLDLGCGEGRLLQLLMKEKQFKEVVGMDVAVSLLERAHSRLKIDRLPPKQAERIKLIHGSLMYRDRRLEGYDAAAVVEVIEHLDPPRLAAFERAVFEFAQPRVVVITTPNSEYNVLFESMEPGQMRHKDHRFEWTRAEFEGWARELAERHGYRVRFLPLGPVDATHGAPSLMGVFEYGA